MSTKAQETFIKSLKEVELEVTDIEFSHLSTIKKGYATYIDYKIEDNIQALFMYGPSEWNVELSITKGGRKYEFKDLLQIPSIFQWVINNKSKLRKNIKVKDEIALFVDLLSFVIETKALT